jgi:hypothetical protein
MGYELHATLSTIGDTQSFMVAPGRSSIDLVLDAIAVKLPHAVSPPTNTPYRSAFLTPDEAAVLFTIWHGDLLILTDPEHAPDGSARFGDGMADGWLDALVMTIDRMRELAIQGYSARFDAE